MSENQTIASAVNGVLTPILDAVSLSELETYPLADVVALLFDKSVELPAFLFRDLFNATQDPETGLTPHQLAEQRAELVAAAQECLDWHTMSGDDFYAKHPKVKVRLRENFDDTTDARLRAAIAKATAPA